MSGQAKLSAFFQRGGSTSKRPVLALLSQVGESMVTASSASNTSTSTESSSKTEAMKRHRDENDGDSEAKAENKRLHVSDEESMSQLQREKVDKNRINAMMTFAKKQTQGLVTDIETSWFAALQGEFSKPYFLKLAAFAEEERKKHTIYPPPEHVFAWTKMTPVDKVKVVILGQDPYHGPNQAHGLCFSVRKEVPSPPSLENMFKELLSDIDGFTKPNHGCLIGWAEQGVLLLNAVLTVRAHAANSHKDKGWETFTDAVVAWLDKNTDGTVFMLWGSYAQKKGARINRKKHHVLQGVHPSPLSAHRGFFGCKHFSRCNELLTAQGKTPIDWSRFV